MLNLKAGSEAHVCNYVSVEADWKQLRQRWLGVGLAGFKPDYILSFYSLSLADSSVMSFETNIEVP